MRQIISSVLLVAMCIGSMASVIWLLNFGGFNLLLRLASASQPSQPWFWLKNLLNGVPAPREKSRKHRRSKDNCWRAFTSSSNRPPGARTAEMTARA
jgi:hypothetical protein